MGSSAGFDAEHLWLVEKVVIITAVPAPVLKDAQEK